MVTLIFRIIYRNTILVYNKMEIFSFNIFVYKFYKKILILELNYDFNNS